MLAPSVLAARVLAASVRAARVREGVVLLLLAPLQFACQAPPGPVFPPISPPIVWPAPPDEPRIRYVGQLTGEGSLGAPGRGLDALRAALVGPKPAASFSTPMAVAVRGDRVYVADAQLGAVHVLDLSNRTYAAIREAAGAPLQWPIDVVALPGSAVGGPAMAAANPPYPAADSAIAVADARRRAVFVFDANARCLRTIGAGVLERPSSLAWNPSRGELWVADAAAHALCAFDLGGAELRRLGARGGAPGAFNFPAGLTYDAAAGLVVADSMNFRVQVLDEAGVPRSVFGRKGDAAGDFSLPRDAAVDSERHVYVLDNQFENVQVFDGSGRLLLAFGQEGHGPGEFYLPSGITIDEHDRIWIADTYNRRVQVFQYLRKEATQ